MKNFSLLLACILVFLNAKSYAAEIRDPTCAIYVPKAANKEILDLYHVAFEKLREKGYTPEEIANPERRFAKGTLYLTLEKRLHGKGLYPPCLVAIKFKKMTDTVPAAKDKILYEYEARRAFPRVTREGGSRCRMAARDAFAFAPLCSKELPTPAPDF